MLGLRFILKQRAWRGRSNRDRPAADDGAGPDPGSPDYDLRSPRLRAATRSGDTATAYGLVAGWRRLPMSEGRYTVEFYPPSGPESVNVSDDDLATARALYRRAAA